MSSKREINEEMTPEEIADITSDHLMNVIKESFAKTSQAIQINQEGKKLSLDDIKIMEQSGIKAENWYAVIPPQTKTPLALFSNEVWATDWKEKYSSTSSVEPWPMIIK